MLNDPGAPDRIRLRGTMRLPRFCDGIEKNAFKNDPDARTNLEFVDSARTLGSPPSSIDAPRGRRICESVAPFLRAPQSRVQ